MHSLRAFLVMLASDEPLDALAYLFSYAVQFSKNCSAVGGWLLVVGLLVGIRFGDFLLEPHACF
jgi:hypothetical protein